jgi:hypothetical protein
LFNSCEEEGLEDIDTPMNPPSSSIYDLSGVSISNEILCFQDRQTFKRVLNELGEKYDEDSLYFNFNDTTISEDSVPNFPSLDIFDEDMNHLSLRSKIEDEIWNVIIDPNRSIVNDFPDTGHISDPIMQTIFNQYNEFKISDTIFKSINPCTIIEVIGNDGLATNLRTSGNEPSTADLNHPEINIENVDWACGDCVVSFHTNLISESTEGSLVQFIPYKPDETGDTVLSGYNFSWRLNDTLKSNAKYPTFLLPDNIEFNVNLISKKDDCYYESEGAYKKKSCKAAFVMNISPTSDYTIIVEDKTGPNGSKCSTCPISTWTYDFGDGTSQMTSDPLHEIVHTYSEHGVYTITLTIMDSGGCENESKQSTAFGDANCCKRSGNGYTLFYYDNTALGFEEKLFVADGWVSNYLVVQILGSRVTYYEWNTFWSDYVSRRADELETGESGTIYDPDCDNSQGVNRSDHKKNRKTVYDRVGFYSGDLRKIKLDKLKGDWAGVDPDALTNGGAYFINPYCR